MTYASRRENALRVANGQRPKLSGARMIVLTILVMLALVWVL